MAWNFELMDSQQHLSDEPRRSRRTASAQLVVHTDHTHSTDITLESDDPKPPSPQAAVLADLESPLSPPSASSTPSQSAFTRTRSATVGSPLRSTTLDDEQKPSSIGPQRVRSATMSSPTAPRTNLQKRKRSRVTPEQLAHLERVFAQDRSPTAARRKEISEQLGMQERQTQIWFQNRRAKAKLVESKGRRPGSPGSGRDTPPDTPPELSPGYEADLQALLHETEPISIIPCTDLTIGSWHRIADRTGRHDLVAYISDHKASLTWFIHSGGHGFKMETPLSSVVRTEFAHTTPSHPGQGIATFYLSEKPIFYMESGGGWQVCDDWTEGRQASSVLKHQLVGSSVQLGHAIRVFESRRSGRPLHAPQPGLVVPPPPPMFTFPPTRTFTHGRKRSYSGPPAPVGQGHEVFGPDYAEESRFGTFTVPTAHGHGHQNSMTDFTSIPISQLNRPYSADPARYQDPSRPFNPEFQPQPQQQQPQRQFSQDARQFNPEARPFSAGFQEPARPYMDRRATFDVAAHGHPVLEQRRYSEMGEFGYDYGEIFAPGGMQVGSSAMPGSSGMAQPNMGMNANPGANMGMAPNPGASMGMANAGANMGMANTGANMGMNPTQTGSPMFGMGMPMGYTGLEAVNVNVGDMMPSGSGQTPPGTL